jgi:hypothetical protein
VGLERGPLSLVSTIEELLKRKSSGSGLEGRVYCRRDPSRWPRGTLYLQELALPSQTSGGRSVGIVCLRTQAMEFSFSLGGGDWNTLRKPSSVPLVRTKSDNTWFEVGSNPGRRSRKPATNLLSYGTAFPGVIKSNCEMLSFLQRSLPAPDDTSCHGFASK